MKKPGPIINIGSMSTESREPTSTVYVANKSELRGFSTSLCKELNPLGVKASLIEPGTVTSEMQKISKTEQKEKIEKLKAQYCHEYYYCLRRLPEMQVYFFVPSNLKAVPVWF